MGICGQICSIEEDAAMIQFGISLGRGLGVSYVLSAICHGSPVASVLGFGGILEGHQCIICIGC